MLKLALAGFGVLVISMMISVGVHYSDWRAHGKWCQQHSHAMPAHRQPGESVPMWMPKGCP